MGATPKEHKLSRLEAVKQSENPPEVDLPEIHPAFDSMVGLFFSTGQAISTGMGLIPLSWQELRAWRLENRYELTLWEIETLRKMSEAYCTEYSKASDPLRKAPYIKVLENVEETEKVEVEKAMNFRNAIRSAGKKK